jgi:hypothetical protein
VEFWDAVPGEELHTGHNTGARNLGFGTDGKQRVSADGRFDKSSSEFRCF